MKLKKVKVRKTVSYNAVKNELLNYFFFSSQEDDEEAWRSRNIGILARFNNPIRERESTKRKFSNRRGANYNNFQRKAVF